MKSLHSVFEKEKEELLSEADEFYRILSHLRYEGKISRNKNLKAMGKTVKKLGTLLKRHRVLQEKAVFPFLKVHYPKYGPAIHLLQAEHENIIENEKKLAFIFKKISKVSGPVEDGIFYHAGIYLTALLRHHLGFEDKFIRKSLSGELNTRELREVGKRTNLLLRRNT